MMINHRCHFDIIRNRMPAGAGLAIDHHHGIFFTPIDLLNRFEIDVQAAYHRLVLCPAYETITGENAGLLQLFLEQVSQAEHTAQAVRIRVNVGNEDDALEAIKAFQQLMRRTCAARFAVAAPVGVLFPSGRVRRHKQYPFPVGVTGVTKAPSRNREVQCA